MLATVAVTLVVPRFSHTLRTELPLGIGLLILWRSITYLAQRWARSHRPTPTLIIGSGILGCKIAEAIQNHPGYGLRGLGLVDGFGSDELGLPLPVLGTIRDLPKLVEHYAIRCVIVAFGADRETNMVEILRACNSARLEVYVVPRLFELGIASSTFDNDEVWGFPLQRAKRAAMRTPSWRTKRVVDVAISSASLVLLAPVFGLAALGVRLTSPGPIFFKQERVGQKGRVVNVLKFRTMPHAPNSDTTWTVAEQTLTRTGRLLRKASIDELPQLINVLRGDMSLVGPRPERPHFVRRFSDEVTRYGDRHRVPVGLTGWAQVHGLRGDTSIEDRARFDNYYIENWSVWLDLVIMARTLSHIVQTIGAKPTKIASGEVLPHPSLGDVGRPSNGAAPNPTPANG